MGERRRGLSQSEATPVVDTGGTKRPAGKPKQQQSRPWWWYLTPAGIANEAKYRARQLRRINAGYTRVGNMGVLPIYRAPSGKIETSLPAQRDVVLGAAKVPGNAANIVVNAAQRATNGGKPADPRSTPVGRAVEGVQRGLTAAMGMPQVEERRPEDLFWQEMGENAVAGALGTAVAARVVGANAFTQGAFKNVAPWAQKALRWTAGTGLESFVATPLVDNTQGNVANAFGENAPFAIQPTDDPLSAAAKSLIPNAGAEILAAGMFLGTGESLGAIGKRLKAGRDIEEVVQARQWATDQGLQVESEGRYDFPEPAAAPPPEPAAAPTTRAEAEAQLLGEEPAAPAEIPSQEMTTGGAVSEGKLPEADPDADPWYDPGLPEVDTAVRAVQRLDDEQLAAVAAGDGPVLPELETQLATQQADFQVQEGLGLDMTAAEPEKLALPMVPWEDQWAQLPNQTLLSLAHPDNNPEMFAAIRRFTGREFNEFTRADVLDGLNYMARDGKLLMPNRVQDGALLYDVNAIQVAPEVFQFKQGVDAQGQQVGNSLSGVERWNTDAEGVIQIWTDPRDGLPYVVNGHNRLAKAKELGIPSIRAEELLAKTPEQARAQGAISNISQGGGTAFDAAKFIREMGIQDAAGLEASGIPLSSGLGVQGLALSKLPDNLFQAAVNGELPMGRALALGGSGLDHEGMIRVYQLAQGREMTDRTFSELTQMASTAPKVESDQMGLFGPEVMDTIVVKADLAGRVRAELTSNKNLFKKVGRKKSANALQEKAGTTVDQGAAADAASVAEAVLGQFDQTKYAEGTPISQLLNEGAAEIAAGAKPGVVAKRILQQLEAATEQAPPTPVAKPEAAPERAVQQWESWTPEKRAAKAEEAQSLLLSPKKLENRLAYEAEYKANEAQVQEYLDDMPGSNSGKEMTEEEFAAKYGPDDQHPKLMGGGSKAVPKQLKELKAHRWAQEYLDWFNSQKLTPEQRTELQKQVVQKAIQNGEVRPSETPIPELPEGPRDLNDPTKSLEDEVRLAEHYGAEDAVRDQVELEAKRLQMGWDSMSLDEKKANGMVDEWDTRGQGRYFHGAAGEIQLVEGGEFSGDGMNIYGDGFYATDDLTTANKYQKKNRVKGQDGVTYEVQEKGSIKFFDLDKPVSEEVLGLLRENGGYDSMQELIDTAIYEAGSGASLAKVMDEMRGYSREFNIPAYEIQEVWQNFTWDLQKQGYGGFTHVGGNKAGRGKRNHQVRIYWDPANNIELKRVGGETAAAVAAPAIEIPAGASRKITVKTSDSRIRGAAESLAGWLKEPGRPAMSIDKALELVRAKGAILDPDKIPGLSMDAARNDKTMGRSTPETEAVAAAYRQHYGLDALGPVSDIDAENVMLSIDNPAYVLRPEDTAARQELESVITEAVGRITGTGDPVFSDQLARYLVPSEHGGDGIKYGAQTGFYEPITDVVNILGMLERPPGEIMETAYHESWHRIQYSLLTQKDMAVFDSVFGKAKVGDLASLRGARGKASIERQAYAFQVYAAARAEGVMPASEAIRTQMVDMLDAQLPRKDGKTWEGTFRGEAAVRILQAFERLWEFLERVNNGVRGRGFESVESLYEKAFQGELQKTRALDYVAMQSTPDQKARLAKLAEWRADNQKAVTEINQMVASIDEQINALKAQAMAGGC